ncbi:MAG: hypothetical protein NVS3B20_01300 [Polyangiales bacterium]
MSSSQPSRDPSANDYSVILLEPQQTEVLAIAKVLTSNVANVSVISSVDALPKDNSWDLVVADYDLLDDENRKKLVAACRHRSARGNLLIYSNQLDGNYLTTVFGDLGLTNLLSKNPKVDAEELLITIQKLLLKDIFGIEKYFPWGTQTSSVSISSSEELNDVLSAARAFAASVAINSRLVFKFATATEELVLNALYNAPVDAAKERRFASFSRSQKIQLGPQEVIDVCFASDGRRLGVSVRDPFGSLTVEAVLSYLSKCFRRGEDQVETKAGGAGLGLYFAFESLSHLIINLREGSLTETIGLMDIRGTHRDFLERSKSFNIFLAD